MRDSQVKIVYSKNFSCLLLHEDRILSYIFNLRVSPILEYVDDVRRLYLGLSISFFLFGAADCLALCYQFVTPE